MFSIIIPFYNTSPNAFDRLLKSIEKQTVKPTGLELIIIDDHSDRDKKPKINIDIDYTILRNSRNRGPGYSRQKGIEVAKNDYVLFMDSDDEFYSDSAFEEYIKGIKTNPDIIYAKYIRVFHKLQIRNKYHVDIWGQCFKKSFLIENNIKFEPFYYGEDMLFSTLAIQRTSNIYRIENGIIIQYHDNEGSLTHTDPNIFGLLLALDLLQFMKYAHDNNFDIDIVNQTLNDNLRVISHINIDYVGFYFLLSCFLGSCIMNYCPLSKELYCIKDEKTYREAKKYIWSMIKIICAKESPRKQKILKRHFKRCLADGEALRRMYD